MLRRYGDVQMFGKKKVKEKKVKKQKEKKETSKVVLFVVFLICIEILLYTEVMVFVLRDSNTLYTLVSVPITLVPITLGYYWKARSQNMKGGITYDTAMTKLESDLGVANSIIMSDMCEKNQSEDIELNLDNIVNDIGNDNNEGDG